MVAHAGHFASTFPRDHDNVDHAHRQQPVDRKLMVLSCPRPIRGRRFGVGDAGPMPVHHCSFARATVRRRSVDHSPHGQAQIAVATTAT